MSSRRAHGSAGHGGPSRPISRWKAPESRGARLAAIVALLVSLAMVSAPAAADDAPALSNRSATSPAEQALVEQYWTSDRRARAAGAGSSWQATGRDRTPPVSAPGQQVARRRPLGAGAVPGTILTPTAPSPSTGARYPGHDLVTSTTGLLFTTVGTEDVACSATVVTSPSQDLLVTAGHCVHGGAGGSFARNVVFIPGYRSGTAPHGVWTARQLTTTAGWALRSDFNADTGFVLLNTRRGHHIEQVVGAQNIAFNVPRTATRYIFGYPKLAPYTGDTLVYCAGTPAPDPYGGSSLGVRCSMTGGASGGPWLSDFGRRAPGYGSVDGVISYAYADDPHTVYGTYFGPVQEALYYYSYRL